MMAAPITVTGAALEPGAPVVLFPTRIYGGGVEQVGQGRQYDIAPDGRFLINAVLDSAAAPITLLMNWNPEAKKCTVERRMRQWPQRLSTHRRLAFGPTHSPVQQRTQLRRRVLLHVGEDVGVRS